jgi:segregation and condensation protein A
MASWLLQLKSKTLLPRAAEGGEDPRQELVERLLEYRRIKELAAMLYDAHVVRRGMWETEVVTELAPSEMEFDLEDLDLRQLAFTYLDVMQRHAAAHPPPLQLIPLRFSVEEKMRALYTAVRDEGLYPLLRNLHAGPDSEEMVVLFVAALELVRLGGVRAEQRRPFAEIYLRPSRRELDPEAFFAGREAASGS